MRMSRRIATAARATLSRIRISNRSLSHSTSTNTVAVDSIKFNNLNPNIQSISLFSTCSTRHSSNQYSSSSHLDQSKVVALPFRLSSEQLNQTTSELAIVSANLVENSFFKAGLYLLARKLTKSLGIDAFFGLRHGAIGGKGVRKLRERRIYLPTWVVDSTFELSCKGSEGEASAHFSTLDSRFPGHSWTSMHSFPIKPPQPEELDSSAFDLAMTGLINMGISGVLSSKVTSEHRSQAIKLYQDQEDDVEPFYPPLKYQPWSKDLMDPKDPKGKSLLDEDQSAITLLPFTASPLPLEQILNGTGMNSTSSEEDQKTQNLLKDIDLEFQLTSDESSILKFDRKSLKTDLLVCYPVLMPIHLIQYEYEKTATASQESTTELLSFGFSAWDPIPNRFAIRIGKGEFLQSINPRIPFPSSLDLLPIHMFPRVPISDSPRIKKRKDGSVDGKKEKEKEKDTINDQSQTHFFKQMLLTSLMKKSIDNKVDEFFHSFESLSKFWSVLESLERRKRIENQSLTSTSTSTSSSTSKSSSPSPPSSSSTPPIDSELGKNIDWKDVRIQRLDKQAVENRRYLTSVQKCWQERAYLTGVEMFTNSNFVYVKPRKNEKEKELESELDGDLAKKGEDQVKLVREDYLEALKIRDGRKPNWLKKYQAKDGKK